jgi:rhodanese-related sulfurtransferase
MFNFFGRGGDLDKIEEYLEKGAKVIDVRTPQEFHAGNVFGSELIGMDIISQSVEKIKAYNAPIILVCLTGSRASSAKRFLQQYGIDVINGGYWQNILKYQKVTQ